MSTALIKPDRLGGVETLKTIQDVKAYVDAAEALRGIAKKSRLNMTEQNKYAQKRLLGERKGGVMLVGARLNGGDRKSLSHRGRVKLADIGISHHESSRWQSLARIPENTFMRHITEQMELGNELTTVGVLDLANKIRTKIKTVKALGTDGEFVTEMKKLPTGEFSCIYADPPWRYSNQGTRASTNKHYDTMTVADLCAMPIKELAAENCHLHMWTTNAFLFEAPKILEAWGFEFKSSFVWVKPQMGIGNYWRCSHEFLLLGVRGKLTAQDRGLMSWASLERKLHSQKPDAVRKMVEQLSPGPYLELFGRKPVPGWTVYGNEILK